MKAPKLCNKYMYDSYYYYINSIMQGENNSYNTHQSAEIRTNRTRMNLADNMLYLPTGIDSVPATLLQQLPLIVNMNSCPNSNDTSENCFNTCTNYLLHMLKNIKMVFLEIPCGTYLFTLSNACRYEY